MQDSESILRFRFAHLQLDPTEYMGMPAANPKHILIIRETFDRSRFQASAGQQEFRLTVKDCDGDEIFEHVVYCAASIVQIAEPALPRTLPRGVGFQ